MGDVIYLCSRGADQPEPVAIPASLEALTERLEEELAQPTRVDPTVEWMRAVIEAQARALASKGEPQAAASARVSNKPWRRRYTRVRLPDPSKITPEARKKSLALARERGLL